jgi:hypothetical protein
MRTILALALIAGLASPLGAAEPQFVPRVPLHLTALFARASEITVEANGMAVTEFDAPEVLVAHIGADGRPVLGCVDNEKAALQFFAKAGKRTGGSRTQEK